MKKLLNSLYIMTKESYLTLDGENVVVSVDQKEKARFPLHTLEGIICFNYAGASPSLMGACASKGIDLCFFSPSGKFLARTMGEERGNVLLRTKQHLTSQDESESCKYARRFILGKIYNARWVLERATRDHSLRVPVDKMKEASNRLANALPEVRDTTDLSRLRGIEGEAAQIYFSQFNSLILQQKTEFVFQGRNKRPPTDNVNALLSFTYTILANNCAAALQSVGLDPYVGFMHRLRPGRSSLALDLMEELRPVMADRFVLSCINKRVINAKHFDEQESGAVWLNEDGRKVFLKHGRNESKRV